MKSGTGFQKNRKIGKSLVRNTGKQEKTLKDWFRNERGQLETVPLEIQKIIWNYQEQPCH